MKKLFTILDRSTGATLAEHFTNKAAAKQRRDELNGGKSEKDGTDLRYIVAHGPDHRGGASQ